MSNVIVPSPASLKAASFFTTASHGAGAQQQFAAELETPYIEVAFELQAGEDAEHKIRTFCGLEEIPSTTAHSLMSALHTLLQDDVRIGPQSCYLHFCMFSQHVESDTLVSNHTNRLRFAVLSLNSNPSV